MSNSSQLLSSPLSTQAANLATTANIRNSPKDLQTPLAMFPLLSLPQELRDQIYRILFTNGDVTLLRVSRAVHNNATPEFCRSANFKIHLKQQRPFTTPDSDKVYLKSSNFSHVPTCVVNNTKVHIDFHRPGPEWTWLSEVSNFVCKTRKETLTVILHNLGYNWCTEDLGTYVRWLKCAQTFKEVIVTALSSENSIFLIRNRAVTRARNRIMYKAVEIELEPILGPCKWYNGSTPNETYILFRPRRHWGSSAMRQDHGNDDGQNRFGGGHPWLKHDHEWLDQRQHQLTWGQ